jgi:hypothetical protein
MSNILLHRFVECVEHSTVSDFAASTTEKYGASTDKESFDIQLPIGVMSTANSVARSCEGSWCQSIRLKITKRGSASESRSKKKLHVMASLPPLPPRSTLLINVLRNCAPSLLLL